MSLKESLIRWARDHRSPCCSSKIWVREPLWWFTRDPLCIEAWGLFCQKCDAQFAVQQSVPPGAKDVPREGEIPVQYGPGAV